MNVAEMIELLGIRLEDEDSVIFGEDKKLLFLNHAQESLAIMLAREYLTELQVIETSLTATGGKYVLSGLQHPVLCGGEGILKVKLSNGRYCYPIPVEELKRTETWLAKSDSNPMFYVFQNTIYVLCATVNPTIDVWYFKMPTTLRYAFTVRDRDVASTTILRGSSGQDLSTADDYYNGAVIYSVDHGSYHVITDYDGGDTEFTVTPAASSEFGAGDEFYFLTHDFDMVHLEGATCDLNSSLHELIVDIAEAEAWGVDNKAARQKAAMDQVVLKISVLNERFRPSGGVKTKEPRR